MAYNQVNLTVGTLPTALVVLPNGVGTRQVTIQNRDAASIYVGNSSVVTAAGANGGQVVATLGLLQVWLSGNDTIYAVSAAGTAVGSVVVTYSA